MEIFYKEHHGRETYINGSQYLEDKLKCLETCHIRILTAI